MGGKFGVHWTSEVCIKEGCTDRFNAFLEAQNSAVEASEPGTMEYIAYLSDDGRHCQVDQWFADKDAVLRHLNGEAVKLHDELWQIAVFTRLWLYAGSEIKELTDIFESWGIGDRFVKSVRFRGFERW